MWQKFYEKHRGRDFELLSIAVDVQGPTVVRPYVQKFGVSFPVAVDTADVFGRAFDLTAIPVTFLVDEVGIIRLRGGGPNAALRGEIEAILDEPVTGVRSLPPRLPAGRSPAELETAVMRTPEDAGSRVALAQIYDSEKRHTEALTQLAAAAKLQPCSPEPLFVWGLVLMHQGERDRAVAKLKQARDLDPGNWRIRKQIWAIEYPDKFYSADSPDYDWQKEQFAREKTRPE